MASMSTPQRKVLCRAAKRERGNICPTRASGNAQMMLIRALVRRGWVTEVSGAPRITDVGRAALAAELAGRRSQ